MNETSWVSRAAGRLRRVSAAARSFISPQLSKGWAAQNDQSQWAMLCNDACQKLADYILAIRSGAVSYPENMTHDLSMKAAGERIKIARRLNQPPEFGALRQSGDDIYTILSPVGTYGEQFEEVRDRIHALATLPESKAAPGLTWKSTKTNINGLEIETVNLEDAKGRVMQMSQSLRITQPGKTLADYSEILDKDHYPQWHEMLTKSSIAQDTGKQTEAALILHTPAKNLEAMWHHADAAIEDLVRGEKDPTALRKSLGEVTWILGIAPSVIRGGAATTDILVKALMRANGMDITPYCKGGLSWDFVTMTTPTQSQFVDIHPALFKRRISRDQAAGSWENNLDSRRPEAIKNLQSVLR
jgi:Avirulence protein